MPSGEPGRAREFGIAPGPYPTGTHNAITDVPDVRVGHVTVQDGGRVNSGVTAIVPGDVGPDAPLPTGVFTGNGYGKLIGTTQLAELGLIETPIVLTSTLSAFRAADALVGWMLDRPGCEGVTSLNPIVGECNDGFLSDIRSRPIREEHVRAALDGARSGPVAEGCVGAGTGLGALGYKAGIGTSSRVVAIGGTGVTVGVLVQANFGGTPRVPGHAAAPPDPPGAEDGSCVIVTATDAPLDARRLTRLARRSVYALARVGASYRHGSGDYGLAVGVRPGPAIADAALDPLFEATLDAVEEAVLNSLFTATTTTGFQGRTLRAITEGRP